MARLLVNRVRIAVVMLAVALSACNGDGAGPAQEISIALSGTTLTVVQGQNGTVTVTVGRLNGFASAVTLSLEGAPTGVTGAFNPASVPNGATTSTLTITVGATAATGAHTLTVRGSGQGVTDKTATLTLTVTAAPTLALALNPTSLTVQQGQSGTAAVTITRGGSFTGAVDLTAEGAPTGVTVSFNPATIAAGVTASTMTVAVTASAATGASTITVRARGTGVPDQTVALTLTVTADPSYTLALTPTSAAVQQGASTAVQVSVNRGGGFSGSVTLSLEGAPAGVTGTFSPNPATGNASTLTIAVAAGTPTATHSLTVKGTAQGLSDRTATFSLQVTPSAGVGNVSFRFCASPLPIWVAYQDDTGPWTRATAGANNTYSFSISSRGGVAIVTPAGSGYTTEVIYGTASELATIGASWDFECEFTPGTKQLTGTVAGIGAAEEATVTLGPVAALLPSGTTSYTLNNVPDGALDLVAVRGTSTSGFLDFATNKLIIRRGLNLPNGSTIAALDFNAAEAFVPVSANLTIGGLGADEPIFFVSYVTGAGTGVDLTFNFGAVGAMHAYQGVPSSAQAAGDLHQFLVFAGSPNPGATTSRALLAAFHAAGDRTVTLGPDLSTPTVSVLASSPYVRYRMLLPGQSQYNAMAIADFTQDGIARTTSIFATAGYFGGAPASWDLSIPDLTAAAGFDPTWGLQSGTAAEWTASAAGGSIFTVPAEGTTLLLASRFNAAPLAIANRRGFEPRSAQRVLGALRSARIPMPLRLPSRP